MKASFLVAASMLAMTVGAQAQGWNPSSDDLVALLKPRAGGPTRGIRAMSAAEAPAPAREYAAPVAPRPQAAPQVAVRPVVAARAVPQREQAAAPVQPAAAPAEQATTSGEGLAAVNMQIQFETGSDRLTPAASRTLDTLGKALADPQLSAFRFRIEGHTDAVGNRDSNAALSARRAFAVSEYIASHYGIDRARLSTVGLGQSQPLVPTADGVPEPRNRRVQIVNVGS